MDLRLDGKVVLITGASGDFGDHFAWVCAKAGADIVLAARRREKIENLARKIQAGTKQKAFAVQTDIREAAAVARCFDEASARLGVPSVIINNAGLSREGWSYELADEDWSAVIDTNLTALWRVAKLGARRMMEADVAGSIINIASILAERTGLMLSAYAAAKAGVAHLTRAMAVELARHRIRVNALAPGYVPTALNRDFLASEAGERLKGRIPLRRFGRLDELTAPLLLLASDHSSYITGEVLYIDGGHRHSAL